MKLEAVTSVELDQIDAATRRLLAETGVVFGSARARDLFAAAGAAVDAENWRVRIPEVLLDHALAQCTNHFRLWNRGGDRPIDLMDGQVRGHNVGGCVRIFDAQLGVARNATAADLVALTTLLDGLENIHVCRPVVYPTEFPAPLRDVCTTATILLHTCKPYGITAYNRTNQEIILKLVSTVVGSMENLQARPIIWGSVTPDCPLSWPASTADILIRYAELGLPLAISGGDVCGGTSPVTLVGTLVQQNAEFLAGLVLAQIVHPGIDCKYTTRPLPMDLRTGTATFGAVETGMMGAVIVQLARRYHVCSDVYGLGTSAAALDEQAASEKAINGLLVALTGADLVAAAGLLEDALTSSAEQLVIDNEILGSIFRSVRGLTITPDTLAVDTIQRVGPSGNFLTDPHTRKFMRSEHLTPRLAYRAGATGWGDGGYHTLVDAAHDRAQSIMQNHHPVQPSPDIVAEVNRIVDEALRLVTSD